MKPVLRRLLLLLPLGLLILAGVSYFLLDAWLESSGGREALASALASRIGMPVELDQEFNIMLLPSIGVSGEGLRVGGNPKAGPFLSGGEYELAVALGPLLDRRMVIETARLKGAVVYPERFEREQRPPQKNVEGGIGVPEIRQFVFEDIRIVFPGRDIPLRKIAFTEFAPGSETPFSIESVGLGKIEGGLTWNPSTGMLDLGCTWSGHELGVAEIEAEFSLTEYTGSMDATLSPEPGPGQIRLRSGFDYLPEGLILDGLILDAASQELGGSGCIRRGPPLSVNLDLRAESLDLEPLEHFVPAGGDAGAGMPLDLRLRLRVRELRGRGAVAQEAELRIGALPECGPPGMPVGAKAIQ
jgi:hypothetical protein